MSKSCELQGFLNMKAEEKLNAYIRKNMDVIMKCNQHSYSVCLLLETRFAKPCLQFQEQFTGMRNCE